MSGIHTIGKIPSSSSRESEKYQRAVNFKRMPIITYVFRTMLSEVITNIRHNGETVHLVRFVQSLYFYVSSGCYLRFISLALIV